MTSGVSCLPIGSGSSSSATRRAGIMPAWMPPVDFDDVTADWEFAELAEKRHSLSTFIEAIEVYKGRPWVYYRRRVKIPWREWRQRDA